jgi:hypothetical protein
MNDRPVARQDVLERQVGDEWMLYDAVGRAVHVLNATARFVWRRCDGQHALDDFVREARLEFDVEEALARQDIRECLQALEEAGVVA